MAEAPAAPTTDLKAEIASVDREIDQRILYGGGAKILLDGDETLRTRGAGRGLKIYSELKRDGHAASVLAKRKRAVTAREWEVLPASDSSQDVEVATFVEKVLDELRFDKLSKSLLEAVLQGRAVVEIMWEVRDNRLVPARFMERWPGRFVKDLEGRIRLLTRDRALEGEELPDRKFIMHIVDGNDENPYGQGVGRSIFWPVFFKRKNITFWLIFNDKFGSPTAVGKYPNGTSRADQDKLLDALKAISQEAGITIPIGMELELLEAARSGAADGYERLCNYMDQQITLATLGETLTTSVGNSGSRALGDVHQEVRTELAKDDADDLSATINSTLIRWIVDLNFPGKPYPHVWRVFDEPEDLDKLADRDSKLAQIGYIPDEDRVRKTYGEGYVKQPAPAPQALGAPGLPGALPSPAEFAERPGLVKSWLKRFLGFAEPAGDAPAKQADRLGREADRATSAWIDQIKKLLDDAKDLDDFRDKLLKLYPDLTSDQIAEVMRKALAAAALAGRFDITEQARSS